MSHVYDYSNRDAPPGLEWWDNSDHLLSKLCNYTQSYRRDCQHRGQRIGRRELQQRHRDGYRRDGWASGLGERVGRFASQWPDHP